MKILMLSSSLAAGGRERQVVSLIKSLTEKQNIEITLILLFDNIFYEEVYDLPIKIEILHVKNTKDLTIFGKLNALFKIEKPDIIHAWDEYVAFYALFVAKKQNIPFINGSLRHGIVQLKPRQIIRSILYRFSPYIIANSHAGFKANLLKENSTRFVLYNGIDEKFDKENQNVSKLNLLSKHNVSCKSEIILLSVSRLHPYKDYFTVFKALKELKIHGIEFKYLIIGEGSTRKILEDSIIQIGLEGDVFLLGKQKELERYYPLADIFIHSSKGEGCCNVILEAMYGGVSVIASNTGGTSEIVTAEYGRLFDYGDEKKLYNNLIELLNQEKREQISLAAYNNFLNNYTFEVMAKKYLKIIDKIIGD